MGKKFYVTTAIDYVNASPHIGHAFEKVIADVLVRWKKMKGGEVWFLSGTDENAEKNFQEAEKAGISIEKFVEKNSNLFVKLLDELNVNYDYFIKTSIEEKHREKSREIFKQVLDKGEIYKGIYEGHYCVGCESFITEKELVNGKCPEHDRKPEWISEKNYFFKLSKYKDELIKFADEYIIPDSRKNEILSRLKKEELKDISVTREKASWGIDAPVDESQKIYVWFDALINYISGADGNWPADIHVIGKGINWFHSVIWPAMLMSAEIELPKKLLVHGYLNIFGKKISKTLGNVINPLELVKKYGTDSVRYSLLKCSVLEDSDYSEEILIKRHNNELANKLGNLINRVASLTEKNGFEYVEGNNDLIRKLDEEKIEKLVSEFKFEQALGEIFSFVDVCNEYIQEKKIWETKDKKALYELKESILKIAKLLWPFIPESADKIRKQFSQEKIKKGRVLFKKIEDDRRNS